MHRFYLSGQVNRDTITVSDAEQLHHMRDVLRLKPGDEVAVFDEAGNDCRCTIASLDKKQAVLSVSECRTFQPKPGKLAIACAVPKMSKMDDIIDKLTQLGVDEIIPLKTERVIVKMDESGERLERWRKIARSASEQSQRNLLPVVTPVRSLPEVLALAQGYELKLIPTLEGPRQDLQSFFKGTVPRSVLALIGPEGDFTPEEISQAIQAGLVPVSLGEAVLRVDTAAIAIAAYLHFALEAER